MTTILEQAVRLARRGLPVFPCRATDKRPVHRGGFHNAAANPEDALLFRWDSRLIGVPTGAASGIAVLDIDPRHDGDAWLEANKRRLPYTRAHQTRSGGIHLLFRWPDGLRNSAGQIAPGIDVRGEGGYVIWWPAHGCMVIDHLPLAELPLWPSWLMPQRRQRRLRREKPVRQSSGLSRYGEAALDNACRRMLAAPAGQQEMTVNGESFSIGRLAGTGVLPVDFALRALQFSAERIVSYESGRPWRGGELAAKVERSFSDGLHNPRKVGR